MKTYIAKWPNGTISILTAENQVDLFWQLDSEGNPSCAEIFQVTKNEYEDFHIATNLEKKKNKYVISFYSNQDNDFKKTKWKKDIHIEALKELNPDLKKEDIEPILPMLDIAP